MTAGQLVDAPRVDVDADGLEAIGQRDRQRQPDIAEPDHRDPLGQRLAEPRRSGGLGIAG
jgi:hypothetical protein